MSVTGNATTPAVITVDMVRMFMRDKAENNILLDGVQFTKDEIDLAIRMAVSAYNVIPPKSGFDAATFPNEYLLLLGVTRFLLISESFLQLRNQCSYQDGDISPIGLDDKQVAYTQLANNIKAEWDELAKNYKVSQNMESCYGELSSGYRNISRNSHN